MALDTTAEVTGLLQELIRAACVNDGTPQSGQEKRSVDILRDHLGPAHLPEQVFEAAPGRESLVVRLEGSDPTAPTLLLMGHTDVVPVSPEGWHRDPHGGELDDDGWVWGRGAIDMLNVTTAMAVATRRLATSGWKPKGTLIYLAVADEEAGGGLGAGWLVKNAPDAVRADCVLTECGGIQLPSPQGTRLWTEIGEKGIHWMRLTVHGTPSHGSRPLGTDNALVKAAEVIRRLAEFRPQPVISDAWRETVAALGFDSQLAETLTDPGHIWEGLAELDPSLARRAHACTHLTVAPTVARGGTKTNVIPGRVDIEIDMRKLPGQGRDDVMALLDSALGDLMRDVEITTIQEDEPTISATGTRLWEAMESAARTLLPDATLLPAIATGGTDARYFRQMGIPAYGFGLFSDRVSLTQWTDMFHGNDERVDQESLRLSVELFEALCRDLLG